jgi:hypothetical protein
MPLPTVTVHSLAAVRGAVAAVKVNVVVAPDPDVAAVNVVVPHPPDVLNPAGDAMVNAGSTSAMLSGAARGAFSSKVYDSDDGEPVLGLRAVSVSTLVVRAGATVAVDFVSFTAAMFATFPSFSVTAAVRPLHADG